MSPPGVLGAPETTGEQPIADQPTRPWWRAVLVEWVLRAFAIGAYLVMLAIVAGAWLGDTARYSLLAMMLTEGITLALIVFARIASRRDVSPIPALAVLYTTTFFLFLDYGPSTIRLIPEWAAAGAQFAGLAWQMAAKLALGRAFGVLPAARGLVVSGPYRVVRHPIYLGYMVSEVGFLLANLSTRNTLIVAVLFLAQGLRMLREEAVLEASGVGSAYRDYRTRVRWRLLRGVF